MYPIANPSYTTVDRLINQGKTLFLGCIVNASADAGVITLYDGDNSDSGSVKMVIDAAAANANPVMPAFPVNFERGLYVDVGTNITGICVLWCSGEPTAEQIINP